MLDGLGRGPSPPGASRADELAAFAGTGLLGALARALLRSDGVFAGTSEAGRRCCCTTDLCGNRINAANHRVRRRQR